MYTSIFLAYKYGKSIFQQRGIHILLIFSSCATILASAALTITLCIVNGFHVSTHQTFSRIYGDCIVESKQGAIALDKFSTFLTQNFPNVVSWCPSSMQQILIYTHKDDQEPQSIVLKAIDPEAEWSAQEFPKLMLPSSSSKNFLTIWHPNTVVVGERLAQHSMLKVGDSIDMLYPTSITQQTVSFTRQRVIISGLYKTGLEDIDAHTIFCNFSLFNKLFPEDGVHSITLRLSLPSDQPSCMDLLKEKTDLLVYSWQDMYPAIIAALTLERYALLIVLVIIILLASLLIITTLCALIVYKKSDLKTLYQLGLSYTGLASIFILIGQGIAWCGSIIGISLGLLGCCMLKYKIPITLPDAYFSSCLPIEITWSVPIFVFCLTIGITLLASIVSYILIKSLVDMI